jgi:hypothetical protein
MVSNRDFSRAKQSIRRAFMQSELRRQALAKFKVGPGQYLCNQCKAILKYKDIYADHIIPVTPPETGFIDFNELYSRTFCDIDNIQGLCKPCHKSKTLAENALRKIHGTGIWGGQGRKNNSDANKGRKFSKAHKEAMSKARKGIRRTEVQKLAYSKAIEAMERPVKAEHIETGLITFFKSVVSAGEALNIEASNICRVCAGKQGRKQAGGYRFRYADTMVQKV